MCETIDNGRIKKNRQKQIEACKNGIPDFVGKDGRCWNCGYDVYDHDYPDDYFPLTGCPNCHISFCE